MEGVCLGVCASAVQYGSVSVGSEWEHGAFRVRLPSVGAERSHSLENNTHTHRLLEDAQTNATCEQTHTSTYKETHLSDGCPVLQDVQVRKHIDNIRAWTGLRTVT